MCVCSARALASRPLFLSLSLSSKAETASATHRDGAAYAPRVAVSARELLLEADPGDNGAVVVVVVCVVREEEEEVLLLSAARTS